MVYSMREESKTKTLTKSDVCWLTTNPTLPSINGSEPAKKMLEKNESAKELWETIQLCTRQPQTFVNPGWRVQKLAERGTRGVPQDAGCFKYGKCWVVCPFQKYRNWKNIKIRQKTTCNSDWVVYLIRGNTYARGSTWVKVPLASN